MKLKISILALLYIFCAAAVPAQDKNIAALHDLVKQMVNAQGAFDVPALRKVTTADYIEISPVGEFDPREKMLTFYNPELKPQNFEMKNEAGEFSVRNYGQFAIVIARLTYSVTAGGRAIPPRSIRATYVCRKEKGAWKIASAHYTSIRPPAPQAKQ